MNSPNNGHFGARPTVRYSGGVLYWGIIVVTTFNVSCSKFLANIGYTGRANISQGYESTSSLMSAERGKILFALMLPRLRTYGSCWVWLGLAPRPPSVIQDNFSAELDQSVQFALSVVQK